MAVTGAALYLKGNRMAIKLAARVIDSLSGALTGPDAWSDSPGWGDNYFKASDVRYCDTYKVVPSTPSCLSGAGLYQKGSNRIAIQISTLYCRYPN